MWRELGVSKRHQGLYTLHSLVTADLGIAITNCILFSIHSFVVLRIERETEGDLCITGGCCVLSSQSAGKGSAANTEICVAYYQIFKVGDGLGCCIWISPYV